MKICKDQIFNKGFIYLSYKNKMKSHMKISFLVFPCSKHVYSASGNSTLGISFYKKEN